MTLEGKKKWTAALIAIAATMAAQFAPEQEATITQAMQNLAPLLIGGIYILAQWRHDGKKEEVKIEQAKATQSTTQAIAITELRDDLAPLIDEAYFDPFDAEGFDKKLGARAASTYLEVNPITIFFAAQDKGKATKCQHIDQVSAYWQLLVDKSMKAFEHMFGFTYGEADKHLADDDKDCPYYSVDSMARQKGIHFWNMLRTVKRIIKKQLELEELAETSIPWQTNLAPYQQTLYGLGALAGELLRTTPQRADPTRLATAS